MNVTSLYGTARRGAARLRADVAEAELVLRPQLPRIGMLDWKRYAEEVQAGYDETRRALDAAGGWPPHAP